MRRPSRNFNQDDIDQFDEDLQDVPQLNAAEQKRLDKKMEKFNSTRRKSPLHDAFLDQDYFGTPVMLTYKGRPTINTDFGASVSVALRLVFIVYAVYLGSKMAVYDLDTRQFQLTRVDQLADGVVTVR